MPETRRGRVSIVFGVVMAGIFLASCGRTPGKLDEAIFYDGLHFRLKLARYYENLPLHYTGEVFRVQCSSAQTASSPGHKTLDPGWVMLGNGGAIGSKSAAEIVAREQHKYLVLDEQILVWIGNGLNVSFDGCGSFRGWYPTSLPAELIDPVEKPSYCAPKGTADCRNYDFLGDREPHFDDIHASAQGHVSFEVRSKAFKGGRVIRVQSLDFGRIWTFSVMASRSGMEFAPGTQGARGVGAAGPLSFTEFQ